MSTVKVRVAKGWAVFDGTTQRSGGEILETDQRTADQWIARGWVERVRHTTKKTS